MSSVPTMCPSLNHLTVGAGLPVTLQKNVTVSVSVMVLLVGVLPKLTGTTNEKSKCC